MKFDDARAEIERRVDQQFIGTHVNVTMGPLRSIRVFVLGEAQKPGSYAVGGLSTMTNALFVSGGVKKIGSLRKIELKRAGRTVSVLDLYDLLLHGDTSGDRQLEPGDVIFIPAGRPHRHGLWCGAAPGDLRTEGRERHRAAHRHRRRTFARCGSEDCPARAHPTITGARNAQRRSDLELRSQGGSLERRQAARAGDSSHTRELSGADRLRVPSRRIRVPTGLAPVRPATELR